MPTDFESYVEQIRRTPETWAGWIASYPALSSVASTPEQLISALTAKGGDIGTYHRISDTLRDIGFEVRMSNDKLKQWLMEVQEKLRELGQYDGMLIVWDEFTDVMTDAIGNYVSDVKSRDFPNADEQY